VVVLYSTLVYCPTGVLLGREFICLVLADSADAADVIDSSKQVTFDFHTEIKH